MSGPSGGAARAALAKVRELTRGYLSGGKEAVDAFKALVDYLLRITVLHQERGTIHRSQPEGARRAYVIGGTPRVDGNPVLLSNDAYLGLHIQVELADTTKGKRLTVAHARYQYQLDEAGEDWIFRYEYIRDPPHHHPCAHLHVRGELDGRCAGSLPKKATLERVHFPTGRVSLEAVIRLLVSHFGIQPATPADVWWPSLFAAETAFLDVAHKPTNPKHAAPPRMEKSKTGTPPTTRTVASRSAIRRARARRQGRRR